MAGAGYNIPISLSLAQSVSTPISITAPTVFNFSSPNASGGFASSEANPYNPVTATSSAAEGNAAASSGIGGSAQAAATGSNLSTWLLIGAAVVGLYLLVKH